MRKTVIYGLCGAAACGGGGTVEMAPQTESNVVVNVSNVPPRTAKLSVKATLNGQPSTSMVDLTAGFSQFGFSLPYSTTGRITLDATSFDGDGCTHGNGQGQVDLPNGLVEVPLPMAAQSPRRCDPFTPCAAGAVCPEATKPTTSQLYGMWAISPTDIWAVGVAGTTQHYDGTSWTRVPVPTAYASYYLNAVWASGPNDVWAVGEVGLILRWNGTAWALSNNPALYDLNGVYGFSPTNIWTCGTNAYCYRYNGSSWVDVSPSGSTKMFGVWGSSPSDIWVGGAGGTIFHYTGGWTTQSAPGSVAELRYVYGRSANQVYIVGASGVILRYDGTSWTRVTNSPTASTLNAVLADDTGVYIVGNNGVFLQSKTAPYDVFTATNTGISTGLFGLTLEPRGLGWVVGAAGFLGHYDTRP
jgi:photosystem II stability/assembly factor-like uncharacterized protein